MYRPSPDRLPPFARAAALLVLLVLALGLPHLLQRCQPALGPTRVEFASGASCCGHAHAATAPVHAAHGDCGSCCADAPSAPGGAVEAGHADHPCGCEHTALGVELQRLPTYSLPDRLVQQPALGGIDLATVTAPGSRLATWQLHATGPPRPERRSAQLVGTILRQ